MKTQPNSANTTSSRPANDARKLAKSDYEFIARAERAFKIVAIQVREEAKRYGLEPLVWND